jgi:hypothetical protein
MQASLSPVKPMMGSLKWRNFSFPRGVTVIAGFLVGVYEEATSTFRAWVFELEGKSYIWGGLWFEILERDPEDLITRSLQLYTFDLPGEYVCSAMAFLAQGENVNVLEGDWGSGLRMCAISWDDFVKLSIVDRCIYRDILTISED